MNLFLSKAVVHTLFQCIMQQYSSLRVSSSQISRNLTLHALLLLLATFPNSPKLKSKLLPFKARSRKRVPNKKIYPWQLNILVQLCLSRNCFPLIISFSCDFCKSTKMMRVNVSDAFIKLPDIFLAFAARQAIIFVLEVCIKRHGRCGAYFNKRYLRILCQFLLIRFFFMSSGK